MFIQYQNKLIASIYTETWNCVHTAVGHGNAIIQANHLN